MITLKNGAEVLETRAIPAHGAFPEGPVDGHVVLARFRGNEYVTWVTDPDGNAFWGHYHRDIVEASQDFAERVAQWCN